MSTEKAAPQTNPMAKLAGDPNTRSRALRIKAMCAHCVGCTVERTEPGFRSMIRDCTARGCPLYPVRPYQGAADDDELDEFSDPMTSDDDADDENW